MLSISSSFPPHNHLDNFNSICVTFASDLPTDPILLVASFSFILPLDPHIAPSPAPQPDLSSAHGTRTDSRLADHLLLIILTLAHFDQRTHAPRDFLPAGVLTQMDLLHLLPVQFGTALDSGHRVVIRCTFHQTFWHQGMAKYGSKTLDTLVVEVLCCLQALETTLNPTDPSEMWINGYPKILSEVTCDWVNDV